ncbi:Protein BEST-3 [Aphelenchoides avenae]|nr:Protein BEST-3 [Aphelenchus avenae]
MDHLVTAGIMTPAELKEFDSVPSPHIKYWTPIQWVYLLLRKAREMKMIESDYIMMDLVEKVRQYRVQVVQLTLYDWVPVPLVYTQVVNLAVRGYFIVALFGRQYLISDRDIPAKSVDLYVPIMTILQFLFYIGWVKVAEVILNPLGEDDDDFEVNYILDRNLQVGFSVVDEGYGRVPDLEKDIFWGETVPQPLYTAESAARSRHPNIGSVNDLSSSIDDAMLLRPRRRRIMSTVPMMDSSPRFERAENGVVPVLVHNPMRRTSSTHFSDSGGYQRRNRVIDSFRRRFGKNLSRSRQGSIASYADWYEKEPNGAVPQRNGSVQFQPVGLANGAFSRNSSVCSSILHDGIPFGQSSASNFAQSFRVYQTDPVSIDVEALANTEGAKQDECTTPVDKLAQSGAWSDLLPVIQEEEQERLRRSIHSSSADSSSSYAGSTETLPKLQRQDATHGEEPGGSQQKLVKPDLQPIPEEHNVKLSQELPNEEEKPGTRATALSKTVTFEPVTAQTAGTDYEQSDSASLPDPHRGSCDFARRKISSEPDVRLATFSLSSSSDDDG